MTVYSAEALKTWVDGGSLTESVASRPKGGCGGCPVAGNCGVCPFKAAVESLLGDSRVSNFNPKEFTTLARKTVVGATGSLSTSQISQIHEAVRPVSSGEYCSEHGTIDNCSHSKTSI